MGYYFSGTEPILEYDTDDNNVYLPGKDPIIPYINVSDGSIGEFSCETLLSEDSSNLDGADIEMLGGVYVGPNGFINVPYYGEQTFDPAMPSPADDGGNWCPEYTVSELNSLPHERHRYTMMSWYINGGKVHADLLTAFGEMRVVNNGQIFIDEVFSYDDNDFLNTVSHYGVGYQFKVCGNNNINHGGKVYIRRYTYMNLQYYSSTIRKTLFKLYDNGKLTIDEFSAYSKSDNDSEIFDMATTWLIYLDGNSEFINKEYFIAQFKIGSVNEGRNCIYNESSHVRLGAYKIRKPTGFLKSVDGGKNEIISKSSSPFTSNNPYPYNQGWDDSFPHDRTHIPSNITGIIYDHLNFDGASYGCFHLESSYMKYDVWDTSLSMQETLGDFTHTSSMFYIDEGSTFTTTDESRFYTTGDMDKFIWLRSKSKMNMPTLNSRYTHFKNTIFHVDEWSKLFIHEHTLIYCEIDMRVIELDDEAEMLWHVDDSYGVSYNEMSMAFINLENGCKLQAENLYFNSNDFIGTGSFLLMTNGCEFKTLTNIEISSTNNFIDGNEVWGSFIRMTNKCKGEFARIRYEADADQTSYIANESMTYFIYMNDSELTAEQIYYDSTESCCLYPLHLDGSSIKLRHSSTQSYIDFEGNFSRYLYMRGSSTIEAYSLQMRGNYGGDYVMPTDRVIQILDSDIKVRYNCQFIYYYKTTSHLYTNYEIDNSRIRAGGSISFYTGPDTILSGDVTTTNMLSMIHNSEIVAADNFILGKVGTNLDVNFTSGTINALALVLDASLISANSVTTTNTANWNHENGFYMQYSSKINAFTNLNTVTATINDIVALNGSQCQAGQISSSTSFTSNPSYTVGAVAPNFGVAGAFVAAEIAA